MKDFLLLLSSSFVPLTTRQNKDANGRIKNKENGGMGIKIRRRWGRRCYKTKRDVCNDER